MAGASVTYALAKLDALLDIVHDELNDVRRKIEQMRKELRMIQALLNVADSMHNRNELVEEWLNQVKEIADRIKSVIETFRVKIEEYHPECFNCTCLRKITMAVNRKYKTYKLGLHDELEEIIQELNRLYQRRNDLRINDLGAIDDVDVPEPSDKVDDPEVVGLKDDMAKIIEQLLDTNITRRTVLSIVGTGGLGKTTLAQKVFKSEKLEGQFHCCAWLSISQKYSLNDLWREIIYSVEPRMKNKNPPITDGDLLVKLKSSLRPKRYLIILDDVWDVNLWEQLEIALPNLHNASRVIITTRLLEVAKAADCDTDMYKLDYLNDAEGLALLFRRAFQQHIQPGNYPDLLEVATRLTKKCGGLPLALVVLGGILRRRDRTYNAWNKVDETMDWHNEEGEKCMKILARSYEDLPYHLKQCFLYFVAFPEDYKISGKHITRMWLAEGFILEDGAGTMEQRAEAYLEELVQRCLVQVTEKSWNGCYKYCCMHDLLRDLAIRKAKEQNFFTVFSKEDDVNQLAARKPYRAALQKCTVTKDGIYSEMTRSLLCFGSHHLGFWDNSKHVSGFSLLNYSGFRLLKVLSIEHVDMRNFSCGQWLKGMKHLKYLGFRYCTIIADTFEENSFYNLETIDLKGTNIDRTKDKTIRYCSDVVIPTLRHVYGYECFEDFFPINWDQLKNLQTLKGVGQSVVPRLGCAINLRTLGIFYTRNLENEEEWQHLKGVLTRTERLVSLRIATSTIPLIIAQEMDINLQARWQQIKGVKCTSAVPFGGTIGLPCHKKIQNLHLHGMWGRYIGVPSVEILPTNLTKLTLEYSRLQQDPMPIFESLQSLRILRLGTFSYDGTEMTCSKRGFTNLQKLELKGLPELQNWHIEEGAMPILSHLKMDRFPKLQALPELQKVATLQELILYCPSREVRRRLVKGEEQNKIQHIPVRKIRYI